MSDLLRGDFGQYVENRLRTEPLIWMTTVNGKGAPVPSVVWFLWNGSQILVFSQPDKPKLRNIERNPRVALNLETTEHGNGVVVLSGTAAVDESGPTPQEWAAFAEEKYPDDITRIGMTADEFAATYAVTVRITPDKLRGWA